jgi:hypothetical protein
MYRLLDLKVEVLKCHFDWNMSTKNTAVFPCFVCLFRDASFIIRYKMSTDWNECAAEHCTRGLVSNHGLVDESLGNEWLLNDIIAVKLFFSQWPLGTIRRSKNLPIKLSSDKYGRKGSKSESEPQCLERSRPK